jgi:hypothetical protein
MMCSKEYRRNISWSEVEVFWVVTSCSVAVGYQRFGGTYFTRCHKPENLDLNLHSRENLKCLIIVYFGAVLLVSLTTDHETRWHANIFHGVPMKSTE